MKENRANNLLQEMLDDFPEKIRETSVMAMHIHAVAFHRWVMLKNPKPSHMLSSGYMVSMEKSRSKLHLSPEAMYVMYMNPEVSHGKGITEDDLDYMRRNKQRGNWYLRPSNLKGPYDKKTDKTKSKKNSGHKP